MYYSSIRENHAHCLIKTNHTQTFQPFTADFPVSVVVAVVVAAIAVIAVTVAVIADAVIKNRLAISRLNVESPSASSPAREAGSLLRLLERYMHTTGLRFTDLFYSIDR